MARDKLFTKEVDLCAAFMAWSAEQGCTNYAETGGFDILCVLPDKRQVGIEAKLTMNDDVVRQIVDKYDHDFTGPNHRAILIPGNAYRDGVGTLLFICGIHTLLAGPRYSGGAFDVYEATWTSNTFAERWFDFNPEKPVRLPEYVPDVPAGDSAPRQLSHWKIGAMKVLAHLELKGEISRKQIAGYGVDSRIFVRPGEGWLIPTVPGFFRIGKMPRIDKDHPTIYAQICADMKAGKF